MKILNKTAKANLMEKVKSTLAAGTPMTKLSEYRQSSWMDLTTGTEHIFYGNDKPKGAKWKLLWDHNVLQLTVITPR